MLAAPFVAAMQVLVYAGAIMVLFVFVIMLLNLGENIERPSAFSLIGVFGTLGTLFIALLVGKSSMTGASFGPIPDGSVKAVG